MTTASKTYAVASCAAGCAVHSTTGDRTCRICGAPMTAPQELTGAQFLALIRNEDAYQAGKRAHLAAVGIVLP